jgi:hypothetical protein
LPAPRTGIEAWNVGSLHAGGELPAPAVYGIPDSWPHIAEIYERAGFAHTGRVEIVLVANVTEIPRTRQPPTDGMQARREFGVNGTRFSATLDGRAVGLVEVDSDLTRGGSRARFAGWADIGNLEVETKLSSIETRAAHADPASPRLRELPRARHALATRRALAQR